MAELVDALDSGSSRGNSVDVRVILAASYDNVVDSFIELHTSLSSWGSTNKASPFLALSCARWYHCKLLR